ncbi:MAG: Holliday junction resolvase RuvX [Eubacteriales bacterium]
MAIMAVDYGDVHTGIAISDQSCMISGFCTTIQLKKQELLAEKIAALVTEYQVTVLVLGFPKNMDGSDGKRAPIYHKFAKKLEEVTGLSPVLWDERRSTIEAHQILHTMGKKQKSHKKTVDAVAASLMLEGYLAFLSNRASQEKTT